MAPTSNIVNQEIEVNQELERNLLPQGDKIFSQYLDKAIAEMVALGEEVRRCHRCLLYRDCTRPLPGAGHPLADIFLLKSVPTQVEDQTGVAFFGQAGESLRLGLERMGVDVANLYGTNSLKCFTSRKPPEESIEACKDFLRLEVEITQPKAIVLMGALATKVLRSAFGKGFDFEFKVGEVVDFWAGAKLIMTHSPQQALKDETGKSEFWAILKNVSSLKRGRQA